MSNKKSRFLLQTIMGMSLLMSANLFCMDELSRFKDVCAEKAGQFKDYCVKGYNRLEPMCVEGMMDAAIYCDETCRDGIDFWTSLDTEETVFAGAAALSAGAGAMSGYYVAKAISSNEMLASTVALTGGALGFSLVAGMLNLRDQNAMLQGLESKYGLTPAYDWYQLPGHYATKLICYGSDVQTVEQVSPFMQMIKSKFEKMADATIFDFTAFIGQFPHTGVNNSYCIAKKYFDGCQCATLSDLQAAVDSSIGMIEEDFKDLMKLTELSNSFKLPVTLNDFHAMQLSLNEGQQHLIINSYLGVFGYSPLQNGQRVKDCMIEIVKYRAFLLNLQELLATCSDASDTQIKDADGNLNFTLQHVHHVEAVQIL